jgi:PAS domain S-box-containing protein
MTADDSPELAIAALKDGYVSEYLQKPLNSPDQLGQVAARAIAHRQLVKEHASLQQQAEAERKRLQALVSSVGDAILVVSVEGTITLANPAANRIADSGELVGRQASEALPSRLLNIVDNWRAGSPADGTLKPVTLEIPWAGEMVLMVSLAPLQEDPQKEPGWALVMRDITPFKRMDEFKTQAMIEAANRFKRPLAQAMTALVKLNTLAVSNESLSEPVYQLTEAWKKIQASGDELARMARSDPAKMRKVDRVDIGVTLAMIETELNSELYWQGSDRLVVELGPGLTPVQTDAQMIHELLKGLVKRAALRSPPGSSIRVEARQTQGRVYIDVSDEGPSISDTGVLHMFDRVSHEPASANRSPAVELARAKALLDAGGGQLWIGGDERRGSVVTICLPIVAAPVDAHPGDAGPVDRIAEGVIQP